MPKKPKNLGQALRSLQEFVEIFRNDVANFAKRVVERDSHIVANIPVGKKVETPNGIVEQPAGIMVVELMTMAKMAKMSGKQIVLRPNYNGTILDVYSENITEYPSEMLLNPKLQYSVEIKK